MAEIEVLHLTSAPSPRAFTTMKHALKPDVQSVSYGMAEASFKFHNLVAEGLAGVPGVSVTSIVGRSLNSRFHKGRWWPAETDRPRANHVQHHVSVPNMPVLKQVWSAGALMAEARKWQRATCGAGTRVLLADAAYVTALPGVLAALERSDVVRLGLFADIYTYMGQVRDASDRGGWRVRAVRAATARTYARVDGFVLLTAAMNDVVNLHHRPAMVLEGVVDSRMGERENRLADKSARPTVVYAGALRREYGTADLLDGFGALTSPDVRLEIYGGGDFENEVRARAARDPRIVFHGYQSLESVLEAEERAWVLANPRPPGPEFTRFSFPSKLMEYMASGTLTMTTRLPGILPEYDPYLEYVGAGASELGETMGMLLASPVEDLHARGLRAKEFVLSHKSQFAQGRRLIDFAGEVARQKGDRT